MDFNIKTLYQPWMGLMVYKSKDDQEYYIESHALKEQGEEVEFLEGKPLDKGTIVQIAKAYADKTTDDTQFKGLIPENVLYQHQEPGNNILIWYSKAQERHIFFDKRLKLKSGKAHTPAVIFVLKERELRVFAMASSSRPNEGTKLYHAPFHNIDGLGHVCVGSSKTAKRSAMYFEDIIKEWEDGFWASSFSELHNNNTASPMNKFWKKHVGSGEKFPKNELKPKDNPKGWGGQLELGSLIDKYKSI